MRPVLTDTSAQAQDSNTAAAMLPNIARRNDCSRRIFLPSGSANCSSRRRECFCLSRNITELQYPGRKECAVYYTANRQTPIQFLAATLYASGILAAMHNLPPKRETMRSPVQRPLLARLVALVSIGMLVGSCAAPSAQIILNLLDPAIDDRSFRNILVISVAGEYPDRLRFEQRLTTLLTSDDATATPYFAVVGRNPRVTRNTINTAIRSRQFDGVLIVRLQGQDIPNAAPGRPTGRNFQLFLYDYDEINRPAPMPLNTTVTFVSEFYSAADEMKLWAINSLSFDHATVDDVIELQASSIARRMRDDGLIVN